MAEALLLYNMFISQPAIIDKLMTDRFLEKVRFRPFLSLGLAIT